VNGARLLQWLADIPPADRDRALEDWLGLPADPGLRPGADLIGHIPSGVSAIVQAAFAAPVLPDDLFVDVGSGAGKVALTMHLLTGARCHGLELQPDLVARARAAARRLQVPVTFEAGDARTTPLPDARVFYLYDPFTGAALEQALERLQAVASRRPIVVCALGVDLTAPWLTPRPTEAFWLTVYDSAAGAPAARALSPAARAIILERPSSPAVS
jgi:SAM-dependent methyltransferase